MTKRTRLLLAGAAVLLLALIPGSAAANTAGDHGAGCGDKGEAPAAVNL